MKISLPDNQQDLIAEFFPALLLGPPTAVEPLKNGQSGSQVFAMQAGGKDVVMRIQRGDGDWKGLVKSQERAAAAEIAPRLLFVDDSTRVMVSDRIRGVSLGTAMSQASEREKVLGSVVAQLAKLHRLDGEDIRIADTARFARDLWQRQSERGQFPEWARSLKSVLFAATDELRMDPRRAFSHGDVNPSNVLWDGTKAWLVDWERAARDHPLLDLASLCNFLSLAPMDGKGLLKAYGQGEMSEGEAAFFAAMRRLSALIYGAIFLQLIPDLKAVSFHDPEATPNLRSCFAQLNAQTLDIGSPKGRAQIAAAFFKQCMELP